MHHRLMEALKELPLENILLSDKSISLKIIQLYSVSYEELFEKNNLTEIRLEVASKPGSEREKICVLLFSGTFLQSPR